jgi:hypothetical protein
MESGSHAALAIRLRALALWGGGQRPGATLADAHLAFRDEGLSSLRRLRKTRMHGRRGTRRASAAALLLGGRPALTGACLPWAAANKGRARMGQRRAAARLPSGGRPVKALTCAGDAMDLKATIDAMRAQMRLRVGSRSTIVCCAFTVSCEGGRALTSTKLGVVLRWRPTPPAPGLVIVFHVFNVSVRWQGGHGPAEKAFCDF